MKEIILTDIEWRETIGHTKNMELPKYVNRPLPNIPVRYDPNTETYTVIAPTKTDKQ